MTTFRLNYNSNNVDIKVRRDGFKFQQIQKKGQIRSGSGKIAIINQHGIQEIDITAIFAESVYRELFGWWSWARQGKVFSFSMDSTKSFDTTLDGTAAAGQKVIPITQPLLNTGFENLDGADDFTDWGESTGGGGTVADETVIVNTGSHAVKATAGVGAFGYVYQDIIVIPGERYTLYFYTRGDGSNGGGYNIYDQTNSAHIIPLTSTGIIGTIYTLFSIEFSAPADCTTVRIYLTTSGGTLTIGYFDDAYIMAGFAVGDHCLIRAEDNDDEFEIVEIASIDPGVSVTAVDNLIYSYTSSDIFRHWQYWPELRSLDTEFNPKLLPGNEYYEHTFRFSEKL